MRIAIAALMVVVTGSAIAQDHHGFSKGARYQERTGEALYRSICQGCHMPDGRGATGAATYPSLAVNAKLANAGYPLLTVLNGRRNMPAFAATLDDTQIAAVVSYVRSHFGNAYGDEVSADQVAKLRPPK